MKSIDVSLTKKFVEGAPLIDGMLFIKVLPGPKKRAKGEQPVTLMIGVLDPSSGEELTEMHTIVLREGDSINLTDIRESFKFIIYPA